MEILTLLLPVLWATVSTVIALLLYRTSEAFFESSRTDEKGRRKIRLLGSVVIAGAAFYGLKSTTPSARLAATPPGTVVVEAGRLAQAERDIQAVDRLALELSGCIAANDTSQCRERIRLLRSHVASAIRSVGTIEKGIDQE